MALTTCEPCCNPEEFSRMQESYRASVLRILCDQLTELVAIAAGGGGGGGGGTASAFGAAVPANGTAAGFSDGTNMQAGRVYDTDSGAGSEFTLGAQLRFAASGGSVAAPGSATDGLLVNLGANNDVTVTGSVSANITNASGASAVNIQDGGNSITVDGTVGATQSGTWILGANSGVDIGDVTINNASGASAVNIQDGGNSITVDGTITANAGTGTFTSGGPVAHDGVSTQNPLIGGSIARTSYNTAVAQNDVAQEISDTLGRKVVTPYALRGTEFVGVSASDITNTTSTAVKAAGGAGTRYIITSITVSNMAASVSTRVDILSASTVIWSGPAAKDGGGYTITFPCGLVCGVNEAINAQCGTTASATRVAVSGYIDTI